MGAAIGTFVRRWYFAFAMALFVLSPELRRLTDWLSSFHKMSVFSALPLVAMLPVLFYHSQWAKLGRMYRVVTLIWCAAFAAALLIGLLAGSPIAASYDLLVFATPLLFGVMLAWTDEELGSLYRRVAGTALVLATISSFYAIYQYVAPPPWDIYWVDNSGLVTLGVPEPFGLRVFGTLNAFATFALFVALAMYLNLPRLSRKNWLSVAAYIPCTIALLITIDRTAWLALALGTIAYFVLSPQRKAALSALAIATVLCLGISTVLLLSLKGSDSVSSTISDRFATLGALGEDKSFADRQNQTSRALHLGLDEPLGQGLGNVGTSAIAGAASETNTIDNGYLARFVELGIVGCAAYVVALGMALYLVWTTYRMSLRMADPFATSMLAVCVGTQLMMLGMDLSTDTHNGVLGLFFWCSIYVASRYRMLHAATSSSRTTGPAFPARALGARA